VVGRTVFERCGSGIRKLIGGGGCRDSVVILISLLLFLLNKEMGYKRMFSSTHGLHLWKKHDDHQFHQRSNADFLNSFISNQNYIRFYKLICCDCL
jgi:hypothetical protein